MNGSLRDMKKMMNYFVFAAAVLFLAVSLIFQERNLYTQATWLLFMITVAMNMGVQMQEESQKWKGAAYVGFFTVVSVLGLA